MVSYILLSILSVPDDGYSRNAESIIRPVVSVSITGSTPLLLDY
jgi:hypothetical protein